MYLSDQPSWWSRPVTSVQLAGHVSTTDISCQRIHIRFRQRHTLITPPVTYVLTCLQRLQLGQLIYFKLFFISSKSVVELCRVPDITTVGRSRVWCAPNDTCRPRTQLHVTFRAAYTSSSSWRRKVWQLIKYWLVFRHSRLWNFISLLSCHCHVPKLVTAWTCYIWCALNDG